MKWMGWWTLVARLWATALMLALSVALLGCSNSNNGSGSGVEDGGVADVVTADVVNADAADAGPATLTGVQVTPAMGSIAVSTTEQLKAIANYSDGTTVDVTSTAAWSSSDATIATVSTGGLATAVKVGSVTITATVGSGPGSPKSGTAMLAVTAATLKTIVLSPLNFTIVQGLTQQLTATGTFSDGTTQDVTSMAMWTSSASSVITISNAGLATAVGPGTSTITATSGSVMASTMATVTAPTLMAIQVSPMAGTTNIGGATVQFKATAVYSDNSTHDVTTAATWSSSDTTIAAVGTNTGLATPAATGKGGTATITASYTPPMGTAQTGTATLVVGVASITGLTITPNNQTIAAGTTQQLTAMATFSDGTSQNVTSGTMMWQSSSMSVATVSASGLVTGVAAGMTTISGMYNGQMASVTLNVSQATLAGITINPTVPQTIAKGGTIAFTAQGQFSDGTAQDITSQVTWASMPGNIVSFASNTATGAAVGTTQVTASLSGKTSAPTTVNVTAATLSTIAVTPVPQNPLHVGATLQFTATGTYSDGTTSNLTSTVVWASSTTATATISSAGLAAAVAAGSTNITAASGTVTSTPVALTVSAATLVTIAVTPSSVTLPVGQKQQFKATGTYNDNSTADITSTVTWSATTSMGAATTDFTVSGGLVTANTSNFPNHDVVHATQGSIAGVANVAITSSTITSIAVSCTSLNLGNPSNLTCIPTFLGFPVSCFATATYSDHSTGDVTSTATWTSTNTSVATFATVAGPAYFIVVGSGSTTAVASEGGQQGVSPAITGAAETFDPAGSHCTGQALSLYTGTFAVPTGCTGGSLSLGLSEHMHAAGAFTGSCQMGVDEYFNMDGSTWTSSNTSVATVSNASGSVDLVSALSPGTSTISANWQNVSGSYALTVTNQCLQSLTIDQGNPTYPSDVLVPFTAKAMFSNSSTPVQLTPGDPNYTWSTAAVTSADWMLDTSQIGTRTASITLSGPRSAGCNGNTVTATSTVTVDSMTQPNGLSITPSASTVGYSGSVDFTATATYPTYGSFNVAQEAACPAPPCWTTTPASGSFGFSPDVPPSLNEGLHIGTSGAGTYTVGFVYRSQTATAPLTVTATHIPTGITISSAGVGAPTQTAITGAGAPLGLPVTFGVTVNYSDGSSDHSLTGVSFASATAGILGSFANNVATAAAVGNTNVTASVPGSCTGGTCTSAAFNVITNANAIASMTFSSNPLNMAENTTAALSITGNYGSGPGAQSFDISALVQSSTANAQVATVSTTSTGTTVTSLAPMNPSAVALSFTKDTLLVQDTVNVSGKCVTGISVAPSSLATMPKGTSQAFTATATYSDGSQAVVSSTATWAPASGAVLTNNGGGSFTAAGTGSANVAASMSGAGVCAGGNSATTTVTSNQVAVTVGAATVASIQSVQLLLDNLTPDPASSVVLPLGAARALQVTALLTDGTTANVTSSCSFTAGSGVSVTAAGVVTGQSVVGNTSVTATYGSTNIMGSLPLAVASCGSPTVTIASGTTNVSVGYTINFTASASFSGMCSASNAEKTFGSITNVASWSATPSTYATISTQGVLTGNTAGGPTNVTATWDGGLSNQIGVTVQGYTLQSLAISAGSTVPVGATEVVNVTPTWSDGLSHPLGSVSWNIVDPTVVSVGTVNNVPNTLTALNAGHSTNIQAQSGTVQSSFLGVSVSTACLTSITLSTPTTTLPSGVPFIVSAACAYSDHSSPPCMPTFGATGGVNGSFFLSSASNGQFVAGASNGTVTATVAAAGSCQAVSATPLAITAGTATLASISVSPGSATIPVNTSQAYTSQGTYSGTTGAGTYDLSSVATLSSSNTAVATANALPRNMTQPSTVQGVSAGTSTVTSSYGGVASNVGSLTVNTTKVLQSIAVTASVNSVANCPSANGACTTTNAASYPAGGYTLQLHATGTYNDHSTADLTSSATWSLSGTVVAGTTVSSAGVLTTGTAAGTQAVQAQSGSISGTLPVTFDAGNVTNVQIVSPTNGAPSATVANGATASYEALATTGTGSYWVTTNFNWASSATSVGTILSSGAGTGTYTAVATSGTTNVTATRGSLTAGPLVVTDSSAAPQSIVCAPASLTVAEGSTAQLSVTVTFSDGSQVVETASPNVNWVAASTLNGGAMSASGTGGGIFTAPYATTTATIMPVYSDGTHPAVTATMGGSCAISIP